MRYRVLESVAVALAFAAAAVPLAHASGSDAGTWATRTLRPRVGHRRRLQVGLPATPRHPHVQATTSRTARSDDGYRSGYPSGAQASPIQSADRAFHWSDAALGAGTAALAIFLAATGASCSAAATTGSPSESSEPASSPVSPIYAPPQLDEMRRSAADADAVCERRDRLEVAQVVRTCALLYDRAWARRSRRSVTGGPQARATSGVARGISNGANEWFSVASRGASVDRLAPGRAPGLTRRS